MSPSLSSQEIQKNYPSFSSKRQRKLSFSFLEDARITRRRYKKKFHLHCLRRRYKNNLLLLLRRRPSSDTEDTKIISFSFFEGARHQPQKIQKKLFSTVFAGDPKIFPSPSSKAPVIRADDTKKSFHRLSKRVSLSKTVKIFYSLFFSFFEGARHHAQRIQRN